MKLLKKFDLSKAREVISHVLYSGIVAMCVSSALLGHLSIGHEGTVYKFKLFSEYSSAGNTLLGEAAHQQSSKDAYLLYSASVHFGLCFFAWAATDLYFRTTRVSKVLRYIIGFMSFFVLVSAAVFILISDGFSTPGVSSTKRDMSSIASRVSFEHAYRVQGYRGSGAHIYPLIPVLCCFIGFLKHE